MLCPHALQRSQSLLPRLSTWARWTSRQASFLGSLCHMSKSRLANRYGLLTRHPHTDPKGSPGRVFLRRSGSLLHLRSPFARVALLASLSSRAVLFLCCHTDSSGHGTGPEAGSDRGQPRRARDGIRYQSHQWRSPGGKFGAPCALASSRI